MFRFVSFFVILALITICYGCQSGVSSVARDMQKRNPQKCMQCPPIEISKECNYESMDKSLTCGQSHIDVYTYWSSKKQMCAKLTIHCSAKPPKTIDARLAIEELKPTPTLSIPKPLENFTMASESQNQTSTFTNEELQFVEDGSGTEILFDESNDGQIYSYISKEEKFHAFSYLTCNDEGKWETTDVDGKKIEGFETVHCIVQKV